MRNYLSAVTGFIFFVLTGSCNDEQKTLRDKGYSLFCWPSKTACENREYGIEFSYPTVRIDMATGTINQERIATLVCCRYIQELIDTLTAYNDTLTKHRDSPLGNLDKRTTIGPYEVYVNMTINWQKGQSISFFGFSDNSHPFGFSMYVPQLEYYNSFRDEVMALYRKCCLREENQQ